MTQPSDTQQQALSYLRHQAGKSNDELAALMERTGADCARCLEGLGDQQASFKHDDEWSIKEVLGHMLISGKGVNHEIVNLVQGRPSSGEARMGMIPGGDRPIEEVQQMLADLWAETRRLVASLAEDGNLEWTWKHPIFGSLNFREWIVFQRLHAMDHLQQIEKVKAHPDYPRA